VNISCIIDGAATNGEGRATFDRKDPMTAKLAARAAAASLADAPVRYIL
jgi:vanillin dehydrogenase